MGDVVYLADRRASPEPKTAGGRAFRETVRAMGGAVAGIDWDATDLLFQAATAGLANLPEAEQREKASELLREYGLPEPETGRSRP